MTNPQVNIQPLCAKHQRTVVRRLNIGPDGQWKAALIVVQLLMFSYLSGLEEVAAQAHYKAEELPGVFKVMGCLGCYRYSIFVCAIDLMKRKGIKYASGVARGDIKNDKWFKRG